MNTATLMAFGGLALAGVMAHVAITGRAGTTGRIVIALAAFTTAKNAVNILYAQSSS